MTKRVKLTLGAYLAEHLSSGKYNNARCEWGLARPLPYYSTIIRLKQAWDVFRYRADALYWSQDIKTNYK